MRSQYWAKCDINLIVCCMLSHTCKLIVKPFRIDVWASLMHAVVILMVCCVLSCDDDWRSNAFLSCSNKTKHHFITLGMMCAAHTHSRFHIETTRLIENCIRMHTWEWWRTVNNGISGTEQSTLTSTQCISSGQFRDYWFRCNNKQEGTIRT